MKTLREIKSQINPEMILDSISKPFEKKMGGTRKLIVDGEQIAYQDMREYYSGRGSKYNTDNIHEHQIYNLNKDQFNSEINKISKYIFQDIKNDHKKLLAEKNAAKNWKDDIDIFIEDVKINWHLGSQRVWHNVIPCNFDVKELTNKYLKNQLRNWILSGNNIEKFGFIFYENDYNYSSSYFLSKISSLNKNNPEIWAIFDKELATNL